MLDEPTAGLDPHTSKDIFQLLRALASGGRLVVVVTHQIDEATLALFDKVVMLGAHVTPVYVGRRRYAASARRVVGGGAVRSAQGSHCRRRTDRALRRISHRAARP